MFEFLSKECIDLAATLYKWNLKYEDRAIGTVSLITKPWEHCSEYFFNASATVTMLIYREAGAIPQDFIRQAAEDFMYLANNKLLDVTEDYGQIHTIEIVCNDPHPDIISAISEYYRFNNDYF